MFIGPIFTREVVLVPRRVRYYVTRATYAAALLVLMWTAWQAIIGWQEVRNVGDMARFGFLFFQLMAFVQLVLVLFFAALMASATVAQEKDRQTLVLLLMTDLTNHELVLGKLLASLLLVVVLLGASIPVFFLCLLLGGISAQQVLQALAVTAASALAAASLGSTIALWRDKTFQALALTAVMIVLYHGVVEGAATIAAARTVLGMPTELWATLLNPFRAMLAVVDPLEVSHGAVPWIGDPIAWFVLVMFAWTVLLNVIAIARIRVWNSSGRGDEGPNEREDAEAMRRVEGRGTRAEGGTRDESREPMEEFLQPWTLDSRPSTLVAVHARLAGPAAAKRERLPSRQVWDNPILWREMRTRGYGRRPLLIKAAYGLVFGLLCAYYALGLRGGANGDPMLPAKTLVPMTVLTLLLVNAQAVSAISTERDSKALDLLLVTDITPKEFIFGKLWGSLYNAKEMLLLPLAFITYLLVSGQLSLEYYVYVTVGLLVLYAFTTMLGVHVGLTFENSRTAVANSLGTVFFLFVGIFICIFLILVAGSFERQAPSFLLFICGGAIGLFASMGARNPSGAILLAAMLCPAMTFYAISSFLLGDSLSVFLATTATYGWATLAMLVPAVSEFDVALGRTTLDHG